MGGGKIFSFGEAKRKMERLTLRIVWYWIGVRLRHEQARQSIRQVVQIRPPGQIMMIMRTGYGRRRQAGQVGS